MVLLTVDDHKERLCPILDCLIDGSSGTYKPAKLTRQPYNRVCVRRLRTLDAYFMRADRLHTSLEVPLKHNRCDSRQCVQGPFKAYQPAIATTLLNGHYKSTESEKEIICQELRIVKRKTLRED
jgi:hypothetical protein